MISTLWPFSVWRHTPVSASQVCTILFIDPVAIFDLSERLVLTQTNPSSCPIYVLQRWPVLASHSLQYQIVPWTEAYSIMSRWTEYIQVVIEVIYWILSYASSHATGQVVRLEVSILRVMGSYPTQWTSMYELVNPNPYGTGYWDRSLHFYLVCYVSFVMYANSL
jgi:hypothetical protein